jgi:hypothetical protein
MTTLPPKVKGDVYVGFLPSESNPPTMLEFLDGIQCMAEFALDKIVYAVLDGVSRDDYFAETRRHRLAMAHAVASVYDPLVQVADLGDGKPRRGEDVAFQVCELNADMKLTLFYMALEARGDERRDTIERLGSNIGMRLHGFDDRRHRIVVVFRGDEQEGLCGADELVGEHVARGVLVVANLAADEPARASGIWGEDALLATLRDPGDVASPLLTAEVARYLTENGAFRRRLADHMARRLAT